MCRSRWKCGLRDNKHHHPSARAVVGRGHVRVDDLAYSFVERNCGGRQVVY